MPRVSSQRIVGRDEPLRLLDGVVAAAAERRPQVVLLAGEAGVGKTRLAGELEGVEPLDELDEESRDDLAALLPRVAVERSGPASGRYGKARLCELVLHLLGRLGDEQAPVLLVLEDLHWADRSTRDLLPFVARGVRSERLAVAVTYRTGELGRGHPLRRLVGELARWPPVTRIDLAPPAATPRRWLKRCPRGSTVCRRPRSSCWPRSPRPPGRAQALGLAT